MVLVCGLPGTGKSTVAEALAPAVGVPLVATDWYLGALLPFNVLRPETYRPMVDLVLIAAVSRQLQSGQGAVVDAVATERHVRARWRTLTEGLGARFVEVRCVCSDEDLHRRRVEARVRSVPNWPATVTWAHVARMRAEWEPGDPADVVIDSAVESAEAGVRRVLTAVSDAAHR